MIYATVFWISLLAGSKKCPCKFSSKFHHRNNGYIQLMESKNARNVILEKKSVLRRDRLIIKKNQIETASVPAETQTGQFWNTSLVSPLQQSAQKNKKDRECTYKVTTRCLRITIVAVQKQYYIF